MKFERYPAYKDSGVECLGNVPEHWRVRRIKDFSSVVRGGSPRPAGDLKFYEGDIPFLKVGDLTSNEELYLSTYTHTIKKAGLTSTRFIPRNTLLLTNSGATLGIPKICTFPTTFNDGIAAFIHLKNIHQVLLFYFLKNRTKWYLNQASLGQGQPNLNTEIIGNTFIACPPLPEQKTIAHYIDTKTAQIDRKIGLLTQKANLYSNLKQSLINETVTRGLDKSVPMKDSEIDWIGEVPVHWTLNRHKDNFIFVNKRCDDSTLTKVGLENIESKTGRFITTETEFDGDGIEFVQNDILFGKLRPYLAKVYLSEFRGNAIGDIFVYRPKRYIYPKFAQYLMISSRYIDVINSSTIGAKMPRVSSSFIADLIVAMPLFHEQKAIADYLDTKTTQIDQIIQTINTQIKKLKELRKTLINDVVTGKIRVTEHQ
ncbi:hypothetical protein A6770_37230 [Nostoc minutum NIES-26]|uniref:Type I restriction modification DNA specificity domain-containing protein n=1 Tax=Nostoc minutum NIES-26 TaxID=1844469 RepID=A0A367RYG7_9NOSO|nr:hypothetical protein A6770_37230 [Nostoc minutum NIES-26]